ncbi:MAG TPA: ATP-dependent DNA ligase [Actinomycetota bacterium]|nr:ATP-dependent DNA ligase [Actinomycetota bacterium]
MTSLPFEPPVDPMLAKLQHEIPRGEGWRYEPKWDGFRALVFRDGQGVHIQSRDRRGLERFFPELVPALARAFPPGCVVDGEIILAGPEGLEFDRLQLRLHPAESRIRRLSAEIPASFVAFDLLAQDGEDLRSAPFDERRARLESVVGTEATERLPVGETVVLLTPRTDDPDVATDWFDRFEGLGLDGVIAKRADQRYVPGKREMVKVKHRRTADCVVVGYRLSKTGDGIGSLLLGVYDDAGRMHFLGHTSAFKAAERREILERVRPLETTMEAALEAALGGLEGVDPARMAGGPSRWSRGREAEFVPLDPVLVVEVTYDHLQGDRFRHAAGFVRWRADKEPRECTFEQVRSGG